MIWKQLLIRVREIAGKYEIMFSYSNRRSSVDFVSNMEMPVYLAIQSMIVKTIISWKEFHFLQQYQYLLNYSNPESLVENENHCSQWNETLFLAYFLLN